MISCHYCKKELHIGSDIGRRETCPYCNSDLHCCLNCMFYDEHLHNKCRETQSEYVSNREVANFCEYFLFVASQKKDDDKVEDARKQLEELFKKKGEGELQ